MVSTSRLGLAFVLAICACLAIAASGAAAQVVVGQTIRAPFAPVQCDSETPYDEMQVTVADGASYRVPSAGLLTSWSTVAGSSGGQLALKIYRPLGGAKFQVVTQDGPHPLFAGQRNTFPVAIPVQAGDVVGTAVPRDANAVCAFTTNLSADFYLYNPGNAPNGGVIEFGPMTFGTEERMNVEASLLPPPVIGSLTPAAGPIKNATITIAGANFATVQGVSFGGVPAKSFTVYSEEQIVAVAPDSALLSQVPVSVTTSAGSTTSAQTFAYEGCQVPKLKGKKLKASKKTARKSDCRIGKVEKLGDVTAKTGKVVKQRPRPGKVLLPGTRIKVTLGA
jgi:hypothetical protein